MGDIKLNTTSITNLKLGDTQVASVYLGNTLVWSNVTYTYLLNGFPSHHAQSLRKLYSTYDGVCLKVRRTTTSGNFTTQVDVAFDSNNTISLDSPISGQTGTFTNATTLGQFAASTISGYTNPDSGYTSSNQSIYVVTWYDQSGNNRNVTNSIALQQPTLVSGGTLQMAAGNVAIRFEQVSSQHFILTDTSINLNNISTYAVSTGTLQEIDTSYLGGVQLGITSPGNYYAVPQSTAFGYYIRVSFGTLDSIRVNYQTRLYAMIVGSSLVKAYRNGDDAAPINGIVNGSGGSQLSNQIRIGRLFTTVTTYFDGFFSEAFTLTGATSDIDRLSIESNINKKYSIWNDTFSGICDTVSTKAYQAHSLRKLRKLYTGPCLLVRRTVTGTTTSVFVLFDSNNTISLDSPIVPQYTSTDITNATNLGGFANSTGYSNPDSLTGGQTIFVVTWYNQSGTYAFDANLFQAKERDATQAITTQQPKIVIAGTLVTSGGKVAMAFQRSQSNVLTVAYTNGVNQALGNINNLSTFWVGQYTGSTTVTTSVGFSLSPGGTTNRWWFPASNATLGFRASYGASGAYNVALETANTGRRLYEMIAPSTVPGNSGYVQTWANGATSLSNTSILVSAPASGLNIGGSSGNYFDGYIQEIITWETGGAIVTEAKRIEIELNINTYWGIYT